MTTLRKFIKIAMYAKENRDLMSLFAITLGLSNIAVSRLAHLWDRLPPSFDDSSLSSNRCWILREITGLIELSWPRCLRRLYHLCRFF